MTYKFRYQLYRGISVIAFTLGILMPIFGIAYTLIKGEPNLEALGLAIGSTAAFMIGLTMLLFAGSCRIYNEAGYAYPRDNPQA